MNMGSFFSGAAKAAGLSSLMSFGGGALESLSSLYQMRRNEKLQKEFARSGIQWRVEDAKAAGVHPLFALGGSTAGFAPNPVVPFDFGLKQAGQDVAGAVARQETNPERQLRMAQLSALRSQALRDLSQSQLFDSEAARLRQEMQSGGFPGETVDPISGAVVRPQLGAQAYIEPTTALEARGGLANERAQPGWSKFDFGDGPIVLPYTPASQGLMESLEGLDVKYLPAVIAENVRRYGEAGGHRMRKLYDMTVDRPYFGGIHDRRVPYGPGGGYVPKGGYRRSGKPRPALKYDSSSAQ